MNEKTFVLTPFSRRLAVFGPPVIALLLGIGVVIGVAAARAGRVQVAHTRDVISALDGISLRLVNAETSVRGYYITGDSSHLEPYRNAVTELPSELERLHALTADNPRQQHHLDTLQSLSARRLALLDSGVITRRATPVTVPLIGSAGPPVSNRGKLVMDSIRRVIASMEADEDRLLQERSATEATRTQLVIALVVIGSVVAALLALLTNGMLGRFAVAQTGMAREVAKKNAELSEQADQLTAANEAKMQFLTAMSHELRTPLNAIDGYAELMEMTLRGPITAEQASDLARIRHNGRYLTGLINDILNFAKLEAGQLRLEMGAVSVNETLEAIEPFIALQATAKGLSYRYVACDPIIAVRGDAERLQQVVINLVANAIKFTHSGGTVTLSSEADDTEARISVADTGRGIPADKLSAIFDPFVQLDRRLTSSGLQGTGLGLAISRDLVIRMGGEITVDTAVGRGSTFCVTLPRLTPNAVDGTENLPAA